jgi:hypothetical protein
VLCFCHEDVDNEKPRQTAIGDSATTSRHHTMDTARATVRSTCMVVMGRGVAGSDTCQRFDWLETRDTPHQTTLTLSMVLRDHLGTMPYWYVRMFMARVRGGEARSCFVATVLTSQSNIHGTQSCTICSIVIDSGPCDRGDYAPSDPTDPKQPL